MKTMPVFVLLFAALACGVAVAEEGGWGSLTCAFVYDGVPPAKAGERLQIDPESRGVANIYVWLRTKDVPVHPSYAERPLRSVAMNCRDGKFLPQAVTMIAGETLEVSGQDQFGHHFRLSTINSGEACGISPTDGKLSHLLANAESLPCPLDCSIHPAEIAWVFIHSNPYATVTDAQGKFELKNLPAGELEFQLWHERTGFLVARPEWKKGRLTLKIEPDETTELGTAQLDPKLFERK